MANGSVLSPADNRDNADASLAEFNASQDVTRSVRTNEVVGQEVMTETDLTLGAVASLGLIATATIYGIQKLVKIYRAKS